MATGSMQGMVNSALAANDIEIAGSESDEELVDRPINNLYSLRSTINTFRPRGGLIMCQTCHKRFHPTCNMYVTAIRADDKLCDRCLSRDATVVCPQCADLFNCSQLCNECNMKVHTGLHEVHKDHLKYMPK